MLIFIGNTDLSTNRRLLKYLVLVLSDFVSEFTGCFSVLYILCNLLNMIKERNKIIILKKEEGVQRDWDTDSKTDTESSGTIDPHISLMRYKKIPAHPAH